MIRPQTKVRTSFEFEERIHPPIMGEGKKFPENVKKRTIKKRKRKEKKIISAVILIMKIHSAYVRS